MPPGYPKHAKPLEWSRGASEAYAATLARIAEDDPLTAQQVKDRVERALQQISEFPSIGTLATPRGFRRFAVPNTGHVVIYRATRYAIRIIYWYRARRRQSHKRP